MSDRRLTPADACWLYSDFEGNHQTVSALMWLDREIDPAELRSIVQERLLNQYPVFSQRIRPSRNPLSMPSWEDDPEFDLDYHVDVIQLPEPGDRAALEALVSQQRSEMLDRSRPLWRFHLIQGYEGRSALHTRIQHAIADGWALVRLVMSLADESSAAPPVDVVDRPERTSRRETAKQQGKDVAGLVAEAGRRVLDSVAETAASAADAVKSSLRSPSTIPAQLASGADALTESLSIVPDPKRFLEFGATAPGIVAEQAASVAEQAAALTGVISEQVKPVTDAVGVVTGSAESAVDFLNSPKPGKTILHGTVSGTKKVAWLDPMPLAPIKQAGRFYGATINDVLMATVTSTLRRYLSEKDALTVDNLLVSVPISLRRPTDPLPRDLGNRFGLVNVLLPVGLEDLESQVRSIKAEIDEIKASQLPIVSFGLVSVAAITTPEVERLIHKVTQEQSTGVVTNVPGPRNPLTLAGANVEGAWGLGGVSGNMNLCVGLFTLNGALNVVVSSDVALTPDPERITEIFQTVVDELIESTQPVSAS